MYISVLVSVYLATRNFALARRKSGLGRAVLGRRWYILMPRVGKDMEEDVQHLAVRYTTRGERLEMVIWGTGERAGAPVVLLRREPIPCQLQRR